MLKKLLFAIAIIMMVLALVDCKSKGEDPGPSDQDLQLEKLTAAWTCTAATRDDVNQDGYTNFKLNISGTAGSDSFGYSASGRPSLSPWPASGTWKFGSNTMSELLRDSNIPVSYSVTDTELQLTFTYSGSGFNGRVSEVEGQWVFKFSR